MTGPLSLEVYGAMASPRIDAGWVSASATPQASKCVASQVIGRTDHAPFSPTKIGNALHDHMRQRVRLGLEEAVAQLPAVATHWELDEDERGIFYARAKAFEWSPPPGAVAELPLCLFEDGSVRAVEGGRGSYDLPEDALLPAQIDLFWSEPEPLYLDAEGRITCPRGSTLWVVDYKAGKERYVDPAERNSQVMAAAVLAGIYTRAERVRPGVVFVRKGEGIWDVTDHDLSTSALEEAKEKLVDLVHRVRAARREYRERRTLPVMVVGVHCHTCNARTSCPAHLGAVKHWIDHPNELLPERLTAEKVRMLAELVPAFDRFAEEARATLKAYVQETGRPITMSNGMQWGPHPVESTILDPELAVDVLADAIGDLDAANKALDVSISKASIERTIKADHEKKGISRKRALVMRMVMGRLAAKDGIRRVVRSQWGAYTPRPTETPEGRRIQILETENLPIDEDLGGDE